MPCNHKFLNYLNLQLLDFEPTILIVGTFSPEWPASNTAEWFYGRTASTCFWEVLPRLYGEKSLNAEGPAAWKQFCHDKKIAITDLISDIDDADPANRGHQKMLGGFSDNAIIHNFEDLNYIDIVDLLRRHPSIRQVYLTRSVTDAFWRHQWNPVAHYCNRNGIYAGVLLTPFDDAAEHQEEYNSHNPDAQIPVLADYVLMRWQQVWQSE
jgi:hypothetical protein